jgi:hypothetical protein
MRYIRGGITIAAIMVAGLALRPEPPATAAVDGLSALPGMDATYPVDGRGLPWLKQLHGAPVTSLPLRCRVPPESLGDMPRPKRCDLLAAP